MSSMVIWMLGIGFSLALLVIAAAMKLYYIHMAVAALVSILVALTAFREARMETANRTETALIASTNLRHMGLVWVWGALGMFATYGTGILTWKEWLQFTVGLMLVAGLSLFLSATLKKDADSGSKDETMLKLARGFAIFMLVAMLITMLGLIIDGKLWRFTTAAGQRPNWQDWAANNFFFFGGLAIAAIAWNTLQVLRNSKT